MVGSNSLDLELRSRKLCTAESRNNEHCKIAPREIFEFFFLSVEVQKLKLGVEILFLKVYDKKYHSHGRNRKRIRTLD